MGLEWSSRCATVKGLQHRGFNLEKFLGVEGATQRLHNLRANLDHFAGAVANNEVDVAVTNAIFFAELVVHVWQWANGLRGHQPLVGKNRKLAAL